MKSFARFFSILIVLMLAGTAYGARQTDVKNSKDHPLFNRMPGFYIMDYRDLEFDSYSRFRDSSGKRTTVEGRHVEIGYFLKKGAKQPSEAQIARNYEQAVLGAGGEVVYRKRNERFLKLTQGDRVIWVYVRPVNRGRKYTLHIIEETAMRQDIVADADALARDIARTGKAAVYGIYFDTGKATLKPKSRPALEEIAKLLKNDESLRLFVVGHTDMTGDYGYNMGLSERRAKEIGRAHV